MQHDSNVEHRRSNKYCRSAMNHLSQLTECEVKQTNKQQIQHNTHTHVKAMLPLTRSASIYLFLSVSVCVCNVWVALNEYQWLGLFSFWLFVQWSTSMLFIVEAQAWVPPVTSPVLPLCALASTSTVQQTQLQNWFSFSRRCCTASTSLGNNARSWERWKCVTWQP